MLPVGKASRGFQAWNINIQSGMFLAAKLLYNVNLLSWFERDGRNVEAEICSSLFCGNQFFVWRQNQCWFRWEVLIFGPP